MIYPQHIYSLHHGSLPQDITSEEDEQVKTATDDHHGHFLFAPAKLPQTTLIWNLVASLRFIVGIPLVTCHLLANQALLIMKLFGFHQAREELWLMTRSDILSEQQFQISIVFK